MKTNTTLTNNRNIGFDFISALLILYMIFAHVMQWSKLTQTDSYILYQRIFFFFMAWFFFKSGIYAKHDVNLKEYIIKNARQLLLPALYFTLMGLPYVWYQLYTNGDYDIVHYTLSVIKSLVMNGNLTGNLPLWFLITLFEVKILYALICKAFSIKHLGGVVFIAFLIFATAFYKADFHKPCYIFSVFTAMTFYAGGNFLTHKIYSYKYFMPSMILYIMSIVFFPQMVDLRTSTLIYGNYALWILISIAACITWNNLAKFIESFIPSFVIKIGSESMNYYVTHWLVISYTSLFVCKIVGDTNGWCYFYTQFAVVIVLLPIISRGLKTKYGKKLLGR